MYVCMYGWMDGCICVNVSVYVCMYMYMCVCVCACVCVYIYMFYTHTHTDKDTHTHKHTIGVLGPEVPVHLHCARGCNSRAILFVGFVVALARSERQL